MIRELAQSLEIQISFPPAEGRSWFSPRERINLIFLTRRWLSSWSRWISIEFQTSEVTIKRYLLFTDDVEYSRVDGSVFRASVQPFRTRSELGTAIPTLGSQRIRRSTRNCTHQDPRCIRRLETPSHLASHADPYERFAEPPHGRTVAGSTLQSRIKLMGRDRNYCRGLRFSSAFSAIVTMGIPHGILWLGAAVTTTVRDAYYVCIPRSTGSALFDLSRLPLSPPPVGPPSHLRRGVHSQHPSPRDVAVVSVVRKDPREPAIEARAGRKWLG